MTPEAPADAQAFKRARSVRVTAVLTAVLGPAMAGLSVLTHYLLKLLKWAQGQPGGAAIKLSPEVLLGISFSRMSAPIMVGLGLVFLVGGVWAVRRPAVREQVLFHTASVGMVGMVALGGLWCWVVRQEGMHPGYMVSGVLLHALQFWLLWRAQRFLSRRA